MKTMILTAFWVPQGGSILPRAPLDHRRGSSGDLNGLFEPIRELLWGAASHPVEALETPFGSLGTTSAPRGVLPVFRKAFWTGFDRSLELF